MITGAYGNLRTSSPQISWDIKEGDEFTWKVTESKSDTYNFLPKDSTYTLEITSIETHTNGSSIIGTIVEYNSDTDKEETLLDDELYIQYNHTPHGVNLYTPFIDQALIAPTAYSDFLSEVYNYYNSELGFNLDGSQSNNDKLSYYYIQNSSNSLTVEWSFNSDNVAEELIISEYGDETYILELQSQATEEETPLDIIWIILIVVAICSAMGIGGFLLYRRKKTSKIPQLKKKSMGKSKNNDSKSLAKTSESALISKNSEKQNKSKKKSAGIQENINLTAVEEEELKRTESEVAVEKDILKCIVHRGPIKGPMFACPHCQTIYCQKCASLLQDKGEACWSCGKKF